MNLELPRGMSATTLPGGKYPYGICQNREEWGVRECLLVEVWKMSGFIGVECPSL